MRRPRGARGLRPRRAKPERVCWPVTALLAVFCSGLACFAQGGQSGSIAVRLTDLYSRPLTGASVVLHNLHSGVETRALAERHGDYRVAGLEPGEYRLDAESPDGRGRLTGIVVAAGHEARIQAAIALEKLPLRAGRQSDLAPASDTELAHPAANKTPDLRISGISGPVLRPDVDGRACPSITHRTIEGSLQLQMMQAISLAGGPIAGPSGVATSEVPAIHSSLPGTSPTGAANDVNQDPWLAASIVPPLPVTIFRAGLVSPAPSAATLAAVRGGVGGISYQSIGMAVSQLAASQAQLQSVWLQRRPVELAEDTSQSSVNLNGEELQQLPISGRHWEEFAIDSQVGEAGNGISGNTDSETSRYAAGAPAYVTAPLMVDGASTQLAFSGSGDGGKPGSRLIGPGETETAIREVDPPASGWGGDDNRAHVETMRGARALHGQAFVFDRQNIWGAQNPFTVWVKPASAATPGGLPAFTSLPFTPPDRDLNWGISAGGKLKSKRLLWFGAVSGEDRDDPAMATVKHPENFFAQPSDDEMQVLSARLGLSSANPVSEGTRTYSDMLTQLAGLLGPAARSSTQRTAFARLDWEAAERHRITVEATAALADSPGGGLSRASEPYGNHSFGIGHASETWMLARWEAFITPNLLAVTQGSAGRHLLEHIPGTPSGFEQNFMGNAWGQLPQIVVDSRYGLTVGNPSRFGPGSQPDEHLFEGQEMLDWVHRGLLVKAGFDLRHDEDATGFVRNHLGTYVYSSVENFISDALVFAKYGLGDSLDPMHQHNCDQRGRAWRDATGQLHGLGYLPCYAYYTQTVGPTDWHLSTNDWAGYATAQWQPTRRWVVSAAMRWEHQQLPPPIGHVLNSELPSAGRMPGMGSEWGPRASAAWGSNDSRAPTIRAGYGMYFGRTPNSVLETALTQTGSPNGDLNYFMRPVDNLTDSGAPPFPYVLAGRPTTVLKPGVVEMAPGFKNPEIHQGEFSIEQRLPGKVEITASAQVSLGRHLPVTVDTNIDPAVNPGAVTYAVIDASGKGPLKGSTISVPFFASWPATGATFGDGGRLRENYQGIIELQSRANSTYEAAMLRITRSSRRGLRLNARYTYAHAMDWNPNESTQILGTSLLDPTNFELEYGTSDLDVRHSGSASVIWQAPWKLKSWGGRAANGWTVSSIGHFRSGLPYTMRTAGSITQMFESSGLSIAGLGPGMNGSGGDDRVYGVGRNTYRYPMTWKADMRLGKSFDLGHMREVQMFAESFNLFNHQNVTLLETTGYYVAPGSTSGKMPTLNFLAGLKTGQTEFGKPLDVNATNFYRPRQIDFGVRMRF